MPLLLLRASTRHRDEGCTRGITGQGKFIAGHHRQGQSSERRCNSEYKASLCQPGRAEKKGANKRGKRAGEFTHAVAVGRKAIEWCKFSLTGGISLSP